MTDEQQNSVPPSSAPSSPRLIIGLVIIALGASMLADNLGWISARYVLRTLWPLAVIGIGISMTRDMTPKRRNWGVVVIIVGAWNLLDNFGLFHVNLWHVLFPAILLFVGGSLVWRARHNESSYAESVSGKDEPAEFVRTVAMMSFSEIRLASRP